MVEASHVAEPTPSGHRGQRARGGFTAATVEDAAYRHLITMPVGGVRLCVLESGCDLPVARDRDEVHAVERA